MQKINFNVESEIELVKAIINQLPFLSRFDVKKILENKDVKVNNPQPKIPSILISDGKMIKSQMEEQKISISQLEQILTYLKINSIKDLIILSLDENGKIFYQTINNSSQIIENIYKEINL